MKTILASLSNLNRIDEVMEASAELARYYDGHVIGYYPIPSPYLLAISDPAGAVPLDDTVKKLYMGKMPEIRQRFNAYFKNSGLAYEWRDEERLETSLTRGTLVHGRQCDVIVMAQETAGSKEAREGATFIADVVMGAGRPVLVVPPNSGKAAVFKKIAIGWNASREACRAAFDSLSILQKADEVSLLWVNPEKKPNEAGKLPGAELAAALARHDVNVIAQGMSNRKKAAAAMAEHVADNDVDLLVLGAYGHMRLREQLFGGVTEYFLKNLTCPVLFAN